MTGRKDRQKYYRGCIPCVITKTTSFEEVEENCQILDIDIRKLLVAIKNK